jgi:ABC-type lipopolysaccharide export system ATPase subunit
MLGSQERKRLIRGIQVVTDFSFSVGEEAVGLFGPNGAGKDHPDKLNHWFG